MRGMVFTELFGMVEGAYGEEALEEVIEGAALPHDAAYTAVGTYPSEEMGALVASASRCTGQSPEALQRAFGHHLHGVFLGRYPQFYALPHPFDFLASIDSVIHVEVVKLYPGAEVPRFEVVARGADRLLLRYRSARAMAPLAVGLVEASVAHWGLRAEVSLTLERDDGTQALLDVRLAA